MLSKFIPWELFVTLLLSGFGIVSISILILYNTTIATETAKLQALSKSHSELIESVTQYGSKFNQAFPLGSARGATLFQITNARFEGIGFGETGEIVIGEIVDGNIHFLIPSRNLGAQIPPVDQDATAAEPMRRALLGMSGSMHAPDYEGNQVLAWYEPLPSLNAGFVAKIAISEIRAPYETATLIGFAVTAVISLLACVIFTMIMTARSSARNAGNFRASPLRNQAILVFTVIGCLTSVGALSVSSVVGFVYTTEIDRQKSELLSLSEGMASLIGSVADFDAMPKAGSLNRDAAEETISQVVQATKSNPGFGTSGEIVLGTLKGENIEFLLPSRFTGIPSDSVSFAGEKAEPMRRALSGRSLSQSGEPSIQSVNS